MVRTSRGGRGVRECADSQALRQSAGQCGAQNELMADIWHRPPVSVAPLSTCTNTYARPPTLAPSVPFGSPSCLLLWPDEPSLFICYYTGIVRSKNQEGACRCASAVGWGAAWTATKPSFHPRSRRLSINIAGIRGTCAVRLSPCSDSPSTDFLPPTIRPGCAPPTPSPPLHQRGFQQC